MAVRIAALGSGAGNQRVGLRLLGGFELSFQGHALDVSMASQRILALLALRNQPLQRAYVAGTLWPDYNEDRAAANLRTALSRLPLGPGMLVVASGRQIALSHQVEVDLHMTYHQVRCVLHQGDDVLGLEMVRDKLTAYLLPGWYEDWSVTEQERYEEIRLRALEKLSLGLLEAGRTAAAVETGLAAVAADPLRETTQSLLIRSYLAEGNRAKALWQFRKFRSLLWQELGLEPSPAVTQLISDPHAA
jgi:DNA-binding SARP family transcriptional activator